MLVLLVVAVWSIVPVWGECLLRGGGAAACSYWAEPNAYGNARWRQLTVYNGHKSQLQTLQKDYFKKIPNIERLEIDGFINAIATDSFGVLHNLHSLTLVNNSIEDLQPYMFVSITARNVSVSRCQVRRIFPGCFNGASHLKQLAIEHNAVHTILNGSFNVPTLEALHLTSDGISVIEDGALASAPLHSLHLSDNRLSDFDSMRVLGYTETLRTLHLNKNRLVSVSRRMLSGMPNLNTLNLAHNHIQVIEMDSFRDARHLQFIYLDGNQLEEMDASSGVVGSVLGLSVRYNKLTHLSLGLLRRLHNVRTLCTGGNPLTCGCLRQLNTWMQQAPADCHMDRAEFLAGQRPVCIVPLYGDSVCVEARPDADTHQLVQRYLNALSEYDT